ncbi:MotA/TolQ/ExbB proton channel family protein [Thermonema rossianum]|uniref:MotA/TolQ/ExbB proton channel family protein n=1 Tax=Thermonema rossianum TaxID=55505 RepID=UPI00056EB891|nr:MotA/TolQ/ExbB proton channel family protein [Thermonema rossianum]
MKKLFSIFALAGLLYVQAPVFAQTETDTTAATEEAVSTDTAATTEEVAPVETEATAQEATAQEETKAEEPSFHQFVLEKFIEGGVEFMSIILVCLILGLAISIERIIYLNLSSTNTKKLLTEIEEALKTQGTDGALKVAQNHKGAVASLFAQGLMRIDEGIEMVEKSVLAYGSVIMGKLERGLVWVSLFIAIAPMLGFMGTVLGMVAAFDKIQQAGNLDASLIAGEIKVALLTTIGGLIVGVILQIFYNYCVSKIDSMVNEMEDASISLVDLLVRHKAGLLK